MILTDEAQQGDAAAISRLLVESEPDLRRFASRVCKNAHDADDAVQHALWALTTKIGTFRGLSRLSTWIFVVIRNECRRYERVARRWVLGDDAESASLAHGPDIQLDQARLLEGIVVAIRDLNPELRSVFVLREFEELSTTECARRLEISEANVKVRLHRARARLREVLGPLQLG